MAVLRDAAPNPSVRYDAENNERVMTATVGSVIGVSVDWAALCKERIGPRPSTHECNAVPYELEVDCRGRCIAYRGGHDIVPTQRGRLQIDLTVIEKPSGRRIPHHLAPVDVVGPDAGSVTCHDVELRSAGKPIDFFRAELRASDGTSCPATQAGTCDPPAGTHSMTLSGSDFELPVVVTGCGQNPAEA